MRVTCICEGGYADALTYGRTYPLLASDHEKAQLKIKGDNGRARWYPQACFDLSGADAPQISEVWIDAEQAAPGAVDPLDGQSDVMVTLSSGTRWIASLFTYQRLWALRERHQRSGDCLGGRYFWASDLLIVETIHRPDVEALLHHLLASGEFYEIFRELGNEG